MTEPIHARTLLEVQVGAALSAERLTIATAESSTGGLMSKRLTDVSGSSAYLVGGVVAYSDVIKQQLLGVRAQTLIEHGAVSDPIARQMADGARMIFAADIALSVTGIAGPTGATATKPVGLTFVGLSTVNGTWVRRFVWEGSRAQNREASVNAAFQFVLDYLKGEL